MTTNDIPRRRAFLGSDGGWYLAFEGADGSHRQPAGSSPYRTREAAEAAESRIRDELDAEDLDEDAEDDARITAEVWASDCSSTLQAAGKAVDESMTRGDAVRIVVRPGDEERSVRRLLHEWCETSDDADTYSGTDGDDEKWCVVVQVRKA